MHLTKRSLTLCMMVSLGSFIGSVPARATHYACFEDQDSEKSCTAANGLISDDEECGYCLTSDESPPPPESCWIDSGPQYHLSGECVTVG